MDNQEEAAHTPFSGLPFALDSVYTTPSPNSTISIYSGECEVDFEDVQTSGPCTISLDFGNSATLNFSATLSNASNSVGLIMKLANHQPGHVVLSDKSVSCALEHYSSAINFGGTDPPRVSDTLMGPLTAGNSGETVALRFHVFNSDVLGNRNIQYPENKQLGFNRAASRCRSQLSCGDWLITIDAVRNYHSLLRELSKSGGFAITNIGELRRIDGAPFSAIDATSILEQLGWVLSFCNGRWTHVCLQVGFDFDGVRCYENWQIPRLSSYSSNVSWLPLPQENLLEVLVNGMNSLWNSAMWNDPNSQVLKLAISWYLGAIASETMESSLVLAQVGLELVAWTHLLPSKPIEMTDKKYDKSMNACEKIERLLTDFSIPVAVPGRMAELSNSINPSGPEAITILRNSAAHANRIATLLNAPVEARWQAKHLSLKYLELVILKLLNYSGQFSDRADLPRIAGKTVSVPWAAAPAP